MKPDWVAVLSVVITITTALAYPGRLAVAAVALWAVVLVVKDAVSARLIEAQREWIELHKEAEVPQ